MEFKKIVVPPNENECPADALMKQFREELKKRKNKDSFSKNIELTDICIRYWKINCDIKEISEDGRSITFWWDEVPEKKLPPLQIKVRKEKGKYQLVYLKEFGEDRSKIAGIVRGHGRMTEGTITLDKQQAQKENPMHQLKNLEYTDPKRQELLNELNCLVNNSGKKVGRR